MITSKRKLVEQKLIFGIYCEVSIEVLKEIKIKYIEDYEGLVQFLLDFHLKEHPRPSVLAIDSLDHYIESKQFNQLTKNMRLNFVLTLLKQVQPLLLKPNLMPPSGEQIPLPSSSQEVLLSYKINDMDKNDIQKVMEQVQRYTSNVFMITRYDVNEKLNNAIFAQEEIENLQKEYIQIYKISENSLFQEIKKNSNEVVKIEEGNYIECKQICYKLEANAAETQQFQVIL